MAKPKKDGEKERIRTRDESFEICGITGTMEWNPESDAVTKHLHVSLADEDGCLWGGHMLSSLDGGAETGDLYPIYTTAEIGLLIDTYAVFSREPCEKSGWDELMVRERGVIELVGEK